MVSFWDVMYWSSCVMVRFSAPEPHLLDMDLPFCPGGTFRLLCSDGSFL